MNHEAQGKEDRRVLSAQSIPYRPRGSLQAYGRGDSNAVGGGESSRADTLQAYGRETLTLVAMRNQLAPPEQSIWSHHLMRGPRRGSPQGLGDQQHHQL